MRLEGKKVLVTGSDGFIGSHLVERLHAEGAKVRAFVFYNSFGSWGWLDSLPPDMLSELEIFPGDVRDPFAVAKAMEGVDCVFHLAALIGIPYSYVAPKDYVETNVAGTLNILQAARQHKTARVLVTSTSEVYGTARQVPIEETHVKQPQSPYSATKIGADCMAESFWRSFELPITIVRPFNTFGPRQSARAVIPTIITQLLAGYEEIKLGALHPTRDLVFVKDTAEGFVRIAQSEKTVGEDVNIATESEISIGDLAELIMRITGKKARIITDDVRIRPEKSEVERLFGSAKKLQALASWRPGTSLEEGLRRTVEWFSDERNRASYKPHVYNV